MTERRHCTGTTRKGNPCRAYPLTDRDTCLAHADKEIQESAGFGGSQPGAGRPPLPKPLDRMREKIEAEIDTILKPYFDAIRDAKLHATYEGQVIVSDAADLGARIAAAEKVLDRVYGKPRQQTEVTGADGGPLEVSTGADLSRLSVEQLRELRELLAQAGIEEST